MSKKKSYPKNKDLKLRIGKGNKIIEEEELHKTIGNSTATTACTITGKHPFESNEFLKLLQGKNSTISQLLSDKKNLFSKIEKLEKEIGTKNGQQQKSKLEELTNILANSNHSELMKKKFLQNPTLKKEFKSFSKGEDKKELMMIKEESEKNSKKNEKFAYLQMKNFSEKEEEDSTVFEKWCKENKGLESDNHQIFKVPCNSLILENDDIQGLLNNPNIQVNSRKRYEFEENLKKNDNKKFNSSCEEDKNSGGDNFMNDFEENNENYVYDDVLESLNILRHGFKKILLEKKNQYNYSRKLNQILNQKFINTKI